MKGIFILSNNAFPDYIKVGYSNDIDLEVDAINNDYSTPFMYRLYGYYETRNNIHNIDIHRAFDKIFEKDSNDELNVGFYNVDCDRAMEVLTSIAILNDDIDRVHKVDCKDKELIKK